MNPVFCISYVFFSFFSFFSFLFLSFFWGGGFRTYSSCLWFIVYLSQNCFNIFLIRILSACSAFTLPELPQPVSCVINSQCLGIQCCLNLDFTVAVLSTQAWLIVDPCNFCISVGLGSWFFNVTLLTYNWGQQESYALGNNSVIIK